MFIVYRVCTVISLRPRLVLFRSRFSHWHGSGSGSAHEPRIQIQREEIKWIRIDPVLQHYILSLYWTRIKYTRSQRIVLFNVTKQLILISIHVFIVAITRRNVSFYFLWWFFLAMTAVLGFGLRLTGSDQRDPGPQENTGSEFELKTAKPTC